MTKNVRIENADNNLSKKIKIEVWEHSHSLGTAIIVDTYILGNPTDMTTKTIWKGRYLVIRELDE